MRLLLISNSTNFGEGYLDHCAAEIQDFLGDVRSVVFVPYALHDVDGYVSKTRTRYRQMGLTVTGVQEGGDPVKTLERADAVHIGGGNTFRLLKRLYDEKLVEVIRHRVQAGMPYIGASAGTNVATLSIRTTNDMPIVYPPTFDAIGLVPFNINPHYIDPDSGSTHMGETRDQRIKEFHEMNDTDVVGLREGAMLRREGFALTLRGINGGKVFRKNKAPEEIPVGADLSSLLER